jgi:hypothetical protein
LLLIKTPNYDALDARIFRHRSWGGYHAPRHFVLFDRDSFARMAENQGLHVGSFACAQGAPFWTVSVLNELRMLGLVKISRERPSIYHPLVPVFQALFAALDILRSPLARLSQMTFVLERAERTGIGFRRCCRSRRSRSRAGCASHRHFCRTPQTANVRHDNVRSWRRS